jgi:hypothetical protein
MSYRIRQVGLGSAARVGCWLGGLATLLPALCLAGLVVLTAQRLDAAFRSIQPIELRIGPQTIARIDLLDTLRLGGPAQAAATLTDRAPLTFLAVTLLCLVGGALALTAASVLLGAAYNLLAARGHGLEVALDQRGDV